jgi:S-adenosylmethionine uptake transporter
VFFLMPLLIALLAVPVLGEAMDLPRGLAILGGLLGVLVALRPGQEPLQWGHLAALAGASFGAVSYIILRKTSGVERPGVVLVYPLAAMVLALGCVMPWVWVPMTMRDLGLTFLMAVELYVGGLMIVAAYRHAAAIIVAPMQYSQIIWAGVFGGLLFGERLDALTLAGIAIIILCGLFILWRSSMQAAHPMPTRFDPA